MERKRTVLIVDDDPAIRDVLRSILEPERLDVVEAGLCEQAQKALANIRFDAVLLDNTLPDGQGLHLLPEVAEKCARVIMLTADEYRIREEALIAGAETVFPKPFDAEELLRVLWEGWPDSEA